MPQIRTLKDLDNGNKLGDTPANYYPSSRTDLEEQLSCAKKDREVAIYWGSQFADEYDIVDREKKRIQDDFDKSKNENEKLSDRVHQLGEEIRQLHSEKNELILQITRKDISLANAESKFSIKSEEMQALQSKMEEEIQALQSRAEELEQDLSLAQEELSEMESLQSRAENLERDVSLAREELSEMESLRHKWELRNAELFTKNIDLDLEKRDLEDTLIKKKDELVQMNDNLATAQKAMIEKDTLLQEAVLNNTRLAKQIPKTSSKSEVIGGVSKLEKDNGITSPETTSESPYSLFFSACNHLRNSITNHIHLMVRIILSIFILQ
jgi:chromosome segregation ATPase